jgi:hypothetical protein
MKVVRLQSLPRPGAGAERQGGEQLEIGWQLDVLEPPAGGDPTHAVAQLARRGLPGKVDGLHRAVALDMQPHRNVQLDGIDD